MAEAWDYDPRTSRITDENGLKVAEGTLAEDAAIIIAAPEMLEYVRACERWFAKHCPQVPTVDGGVIAHPMLSGARDILARIPAEDEP